ncbi:hypothetical protein D3C80_2184840 [compost metagenome]
MERVVALTAEQLDRLEPLGYLPGHFGRVVDDDLVVLLRLLAQGRANECVQLLQVRFGVFRPGEDNGEG